MIAAGTSAPRRSPGFVGADRDDLPETQASPGTRWMQLCFRNSTLCFTGAYLNKAAWNSRMLALREVSQVHAGEDGVVIVEWNEYTPSSRTDIVVTSNLATIA
jgi:hypothetical protein